MRVNAKCVLDAKAKVGECPVWAEDEQALYWIDIQAPALHRFDPATGANRTWRMPALIGSFEIGTFFSNGRFPSRIWMG